MEGLDFAFYKGRSKYHTKYDSIVYTEGGRKALWAMMDSVRPHCLYDPGAIVGYPLYCNSRTDTDEGGQLRLTEQYQNG
jgi:hypothetical protein